MTPTPLHLPCPVCRCPTLTCRVVASLPWFLAVERQRQVCGCVYDAEDWADLGDAARKVFETREEGADAQ